MSNEKQLPVLGGTWKDVAGAVAKGAIGAIPLVGSILGEVVGLMIPNQRLDRIEAYLRLLGERLDGENPDDLRDRLRDPEHIDLFEEGAVQSLRAVSDARKAYIASIVSEGLSGDEKDCLQAKRLLKLLAQVDDDQIIILASHLREHYWDDEFRERHKAVLGPVSRHLGASREERNAAAFYDLARSELLNLGLLSASFNMPKKGELPEFDRATGRLRATNHNLTPLGRLLLEQVGLAGPEED